jgi:hypothetical protein
MSKLARITDLFVEGTELRLGEDQTGAVVVVWVNKPNSFEEQEARADGMAARAGKIIALQREDSTELVNLHEQIGRTDDEALARSLAELYYDEDYLLGLDDVEAEPAWREKLDYIRRMDSLLKDGKAAEDDPRWADLHDANVSYINSVREAVDARQQKRTQELVALEREALEKNLVDQWMQRQSLDVYMQEKRITEIFFALRECRGVFDEASGSWDHRACDHRERVLDNRAEVRELPESALQVITQTLDGLMVSPRDSGNWLAPVTSYESSEQPSEQADSTPSIPVETSVGVRQT